MKQVLLLLLIGINGAGFAQNQGNIWYFGDGAGLDFNSTSPSVIVDGQTYFINNHNEGCSVISDSSGSLLFYSNGMTVWNKNHAIMENGNNLMGNFSSTQAALIVPQPNSNRYFYLFTTDAFCCGGDLSNGLRYSKIDLCLDDELGGIVPSEKNVLAVDTVAEKITATRHANGVDYWIITHKYYSDAFYALQLTPTGITDTVISNTGSLHSGMSAGSQGQLKCSPDGQLLVITATNGTDLLELFDFDTSTGIVSNYKPLNRINDAIVYGVEFSPDNSKLYALASNISPFGTYLTQYDLTAGGTDADSVNASMEVVYQDNIFASAKGLQIGPDGKIYLVSPDNPEYLSVINSPNLDGTACDFQNQAIYLAGAVGSLTLPGFIANYDYNNTTPNCVMDNLDESQNDARYLIYPNPANQEVTLEFDNIRQEKYSLTLFDTQGRPVKTISDITTDKINLSIDELTNGLYFFQLGSSQNVKFTGKLTIQ